VAVETQESAVESGEHVVQLCGHDAEPLEAAGPYLAAAALEEEVAVEETAVEVVAEFAAEREAPGQARRLAVAALRQRGHDESLVQDAALVLSELATNAVVHAGSPFSVAVRTQESVLRVAVQDASPLDAASPEQSWAPEQGSVTGHGLVARAGHGLGLIDVLATRWGVEASASGKVVWAELPYAVNGGAGRLGEA
jgi:anti-sigma regulatory factor (Ser/Thr protein kinase)